MLRHTASDSGEATVPADVTIPAGAMSADFDVTPVNDGLQDGPQTIQISAMAAGYVSISSELEVTENPRPWQNPVNHFDVNGDSIVAPRDVLLVINELNLNGFRQLPVPGPDFRPPPFFDADGDGNIAPFDVLVIVNFLNSPGVTEGEFAPIVMTPPAIPFGAGIWPVSQTDIHADISAHHTVFASALDFPRPGRIDHKVRPATVVRSDKEIRRNSRDRGLAHAALSRDQYAISTDLLNRLNEALEEIASDVAASTLGSQRRG